MVVSHSRPPSEKEEQSGIQLIASSSSTTSLLLLLVQTKTGNHHEGALPTLTAPVMGRGGRSRTCILRERPTTDSIIISL